MIVCAQALVISGYSCAPTTLAPHLHNRSTTVRWVNMGLLTIIRKNRQKEKEMRILFLYAERPKDELDLVLTSL